jgi:hypothetical protein
MSSLTYSDFSKKMNESLDTVEGFTYITNNTITNTANANISSHNELRDKLSRDIKRLGLTKAGISYIDKFR